MNKFTTSPYFPPDTEEYSPWVAKYGLLYPYGECQCGCGKETKIVDHTSRKMNRLKGHPARYLAGHQTKNGNLGDAFWKYVTPSGPDSCWDWQGYIDKNGYARIRFDGQRHEVHRVSYELHKGAIPEGLYICHTCDNRICVNPNHLFAGTAQDNSDDMVNKNRQKKGTAHGMAILLESDIPIVRQLASEGVSYAELGRRYGVTGEAISLIVQRINWKHIP